MAGLPLKSGADFYNLEAARLRLHNLGADPTEVGAGLIYFNTSNGLNTSKKARIWTGDAWKTFAFVEDLDVASNADFIALQEKVALLAGDVDTDAIISNMKEVSAFLEGFAEDALLMDYLNTELGKKLDKSGGTITNSNNYKLTLNATNADNYNLLGFASNGVVKAYIGTKGDAFHISSAYTGFYFNDKTILHSGNVGEYALQYYGTDMPADIVNYVGYGKTETGWKEYGPAITFGISSYYTQIQRKLKTNEYYVRGYDNGTPTDWKTIAFTDQVLLLDGSNAMTGALHLNIRSTGTVNVEGDDGLFLYRGPSTGGVDIDLPGDYYNLLNIGARGAYSNLQLSWHRSTNSRLFARIQSGSNYASWRELAFLDSNVASAKALQNIYDYASLDNTQLVSNFGITSYGLRLYGKDLYLQDNNGYKFIINSSGNVTIGDSDLAGASAKLYVDGKAKFSSIESTASISDYDNQAGYFVGKRNAGLGVTTGGLLLLSYGTTPMSFHLGGSERMHITAGGNVGIGTTEPYCLLEVAAIHKDINLINIAASANFAVGKHNDDGLFIGHDYTKEGSWIQSAYYGTEANPSNTHTYKLFLNPLGGNVLIGTTDDNGSGAKLQVAGQGYFAGGVTIDGTITSKAGIELFSATPYIDFHFGGNTDDYTARIAELESGSLFCYGNWIPNSDNTRNLGASWSRWKNVYGLNGFFPASLTAGDTTINGNLHVTGNIIADGEVSAGGAAEEGGNAGSGAGAFHSESIAVGATQTTIAHGLGTDDIVVSIYEKDGVSGRWSIILTDVEIVDVNNIIVSFGSATTVEHKVVIMGAVA